MIYVIYVIYGIFCIFVFRLKAFIRAMTNHVNTLRRIYVATYHPALKNLGKVARNFHPMLTNSGEHREVFPEPPLIAFRRCKNLNDILVRARLNSEGNGGTDKKGCARCGKSRCQVCNVMSNSENFHHNIDSQEYRINYSFNCDSSNVVYSLECTVSGVQYVGITCTPFMLRDNNYKACSRKFNLGASVPQVIIMYIIYTRGIPSAKTLKYISMKNEYIKIQWMGLIFQGVLF